MSQDPVSHTRLHCVLPFPLNPELQIKIYKTSQDLWIQELAALISSIYQLLTKIHYLHPSRVQYPPHIGPNHTGIKSLNMELLSALGLSADVVELLLQLPYVVNVTAAEAAVFRDGGVFADFRQDEHLVLSRALEYEQRGEGRGWCEKKVANLKPWHLVLNLLGDASSMIIISTRSRQLIFRNRYDPNVVDRKAKMLFDPESAFETEKEGDHFAPEHKPSRPATEFLQDLLQSLVNLETLPHGLRPGTREFHHEKRMHLESGWPNNFKSPEFLDAEGDFGLQDWSNLFARMSLLDKKDRERGESHSAQESDRGLAKGNITVVEVLARQQEREQGYDDIHPFLSW